MKKYSPQQLPPHYVKHSPTGMSWGYEGSGPADLALSLLSECVGTDLASRYYMRFKSDVVAKLRGNWELKEDFIREWVNNQLKNPYRE